MEKGLGGRSFVTDVAVAIIRNFTLSFTHFNSTFGNLKILIVVFAAICSGQTSFFKSPIGT